MFNRLFGAGKARFGPARAPAAPYTGEPIRPRVLQVIHNPPVDIQGGRRLTEIFSWNDPDRLARLYIADLAEASHGYLQYQIVERIVADWFPPKIDGFSYTGESYLRLWRARRMHEPDGLDYAARLQAFDLIERYDRDEFDEAWFFGFPYSGDYESTMAGHGAFWCNSPPLLNTGHCRGRFVIMGFNYERDVDCMLENFGHRAESIMSRVFARHPPEQNLWDRFTRYDQTSPGLSQCGNVHFAPNSVRDYDWGNRRPVQSFCDAWYSFPDLSGPARTVDCAEWGGGDMRLHHLWWLKHLPHVPGETFGVSNNWWQYIVDPNLVG
ncbi:MAG TPA: hypothetical protein PLO33_14835 [Kouleothrix sp.]|uniref:hypothetical protein n=1 Tax=Kouleothrix sp. TaxID=2779161 RepID=UPI002C203CAC|nr:hypothetical protein [Kouleothrix sp.]HRC76952.1 hypothetical protein [Kouleothrix sp.]